MEHETGILPIEVKSGKHYRRHRALNRVIGDPDSTIDEALILNDDTLKVEERLFYAPVYMIMFLKADPLPEKMIYTID